MMTPAADLVAAVRTQLGVPWRHQGRLWGTALDCLGLVICAARELSLVAQHFDVNGYSRSPDGSMLDAADEHLERIAEIELGAVLVLSSAKLPHHVGIVADYPHGGWSIVHATNAGRSQVMETRLLFMRTFQLRGVFRVPGVA